jgi:hypothetical protein
MFQSGASRRCFGLVGLAIFLCAATAQTDAPKPARSEAKKATPVHESPLRARLHQSASVEKGIDPNTQLRDALEFLTQRFDITFVVDTVAFKDDLQIDDVESQPVRLPRMVNVQLDTILHRLLEQVQATYLLRGDHLEITTLLRASRMVWGRAPIDDEHAPGLARPRMPLVHAAFQQCPLQEALQTLAAETGITVLLDRRVAERGADPVTATLDNVPLDNAVRLLARNADLQATLLDDVIYVTSSEHAAAVQSWDGSPAGGDGQAETNVFSRLQQPVELDLDEIPLKDALERVSRATGMQVILDQNRAASQQDLGITLHVRDTSLETAIRLLAENAGLKAVLVGNVLFLTTEAHAAKLRNEAAPSAVTAGTALGGGGVMPTGGLGLGGGLGALGIGGGWPTAAAPALITAAPAAPPQPPKAAPKSSRRQTSREKPAAPARQTIEPANVVNRVAELSRQLNSMVSLPKGIDPNTPLRDAIEFVHQTFHVDSILVNNVAFKNDLQIDDAEQQPVRLAPMKNVRLGTLIERLAAQVGGRYLVRADHVEIVPAQRAQAEVWGWSNQEEGAKERRRLPLVHQTLQQRPLDEALAQLAGGTGYSIVVDREHAGDRARTPVSGQLNNVPLDTAVRLLADQADLGVALLDDVLYVSSFQRARAARLDQQKINEKGLIPLPPGAAAGAGM